MAGKQKAPIATVDAPAPASRAEPAKPGRTGFVVRELTDAPAGSRAWLIQSAADFFRVTTSVDLRAPQGSLVPSLRVVQITGVPCDKAGAPIPDVDRVEPELAAWLQSHGRILQDSARPGEGRS